MARVITQKLPSPANVNAGVLTSDSVQVTWDQSSDFTGYLISCTSPASYAGAKNSIVNGVDATSYTLTNLVENTLYVITVQGITKDGRKSLCSNEVSVKTSTAAPSSPPEDIEVAGADSATLIASWQPPLEKNCNGTITGYVIQYTRVKSPAYDDTMIVNVNETTLSISGLFACVEYSVIVAAVNGNGTGPFSKPVIATSGEDIPSVPRSLEIVTVSSTSVTLQWMPPEFPNGAIMQYSIEYEGNFIKKFGESGDVPDKMTGIIEGLSPDADYVFEIKAYTRVGPGPPAILPLKTYLPAPTNVKAEVLKSDTVEVAWDQSSEVTGYLISYISTASYAGGKNAIVHGGDTTSYTLTNLVENTPYDITVQSLITRDGRKSDHSAEVSIITQKAAPSSPPEKTEVKSADPASLQVLWESPLEKNCNGLITGYVIQYTRVGSHTSDDTMIVNILNRTTFTISGLYACVEYSVTVAAVNGNGTGPFSKPVVAVSGEDVPNEPKALEIVTVTSTSVELQWMPPEFPNGAITKYSIHYNEIDIDNFGSNVLNKIIGTIHGLSPNTSYVFEMKAYTRMGAGSPVSLPVKTRLSAPTNFKLTKLTPHEVEVTWDQLLGATGYLISCTSPASYAGNKTAIVNGVDTTSHILKNLVENTPYHITVQGLNRDGRKSDHSIEVSVTTQKAAPSSPPQDIEVIGDDSASLIVSWQPPLDKNSNGPITGYIIQYARVESDDKMIMNISKGTTAIISGLFACVDYSVRVAAVNHNGTGPFSKPVVATSGEDTPSQPQSLEIVTVTSTAVTLLWKPPEFPNGTITKYSIHYNEIHVDGFGDNVLDKMTGTIEGLSPDIEYVIKLIAYTRVGPGPPFSLPVKTLTATTDHDTTSYKKQESTSTTEICLIPVGKLEEIECDGKSGGLYLWKKHGFTIMLPPDCADGKVNINIQAYISTSTREHSIVSAVFDITASIKEFKKPVSLHLPHCVNVKSEEDKKKLNFLLLHNNTYDFTNGNFEVGKSTGSIELTRFCKVCIFCGFALSLYLIVSGLKFIIKSPENIKGEEKIDKGCLDILILPESHTEMRNWYGTYCITWDIPTFLQYLEDKKWIKPSQQVLKRNVNFVKNTDDAIAEICLVDETDGNIALVENKRIPRQKISYAKNEKDPQSDDDTDNENFPRCVFLISEKLSSPSTIVVKGICVSGEESSKFNLASPTSSDYKFALHYHCSENPGIIDISSRKPSLTKIINYNIRDQATVDYYDLGIQLLPDNAQLELDIIKKNNPTDARACCTEMFKYWLDVDTAASWNKLIQALKHINKNNLAEKIITELLQDFN